jgi:outer membrane protein assembly factor BamB
MLPGQTWGLVAPGDDGPIFATGYDGENLQTTVLTAYDLDGEVLWRRTFDGYPEQPRVSGDGMVWIAHRGPAGAVLSGLDAEGTVRSEVVLDHEEFEHLGAFVVLADGFCVSWLPAAHSHLVPEGRHARVARHHPDGSRRWSTPAVLDQLSFPGVVTLGVETGGEARPSKPWTPRTIEAHHWEPLLVSGHRVAATFADGSSGIAVTFFLDTDTGHLVAASRPGPGHHKAILGPGEFLIGSQGYGAFSTARYGASGTVVQEWPTHAMLLIDRDGAISGPESENTMPSRSAFVGLEPDGTVRRGPALTGYYTSYPALDSEGTAVFWRDGRLRAVDRDFQMSELFGLDDAKRAAASRILLLGGGQVVFALNDELLLLRSTGLGALNGGVWPCKDGGLHGNPVLHE